MIQSLKQLTVRIDKIVNCNYTVSEILQKDVVWTNYFTFQDFDTGITLTADSKEDIFEQIENQYNDL